MKIVNFKKDGSKYKLTLDNGDIIDTYDDVILKYNLLYTKEIGDELLEKLNNDTMYYKNYKKALDLINKRIRSEYEIRNYLSKQEVSLNDIDKIISTLSSIGLLDDLAYARAYTNDKVNLSLDGPDKIRKHLVSNKICDEYIEEAIGSIDKNVIYSHIDKIINKKIKANTKSTPFMLKQKIINYLINLGYNKYDVLSRLENFKIENKSSEKEMDKIYNKLKKKYNGDDLYYKIKNKLYSKGYTREEIDEYMEKNS